MMKQPAPKGSITFFLLLFAGCLGAQMVQTPKKSPYAPASYAIQAAMVRYPIAPMKGTAREGVPPKYAIEKREDALKLMYESCDGPNYTILREEEVVVEGEAVWKQLHYRCDASPDAGVLDSPKTAGANDAGI